MVCTTQTLSQIKSQELISQIKEHFMTRCPLTYYNVTNGIQDFVICCNKGWMYFDLRPDTCYLVYYNLHALLTQSTRVAM